MRIKEGDIFVSNANVHFANEQIEISKVVENFRNTNDYHIVNVFQKKIIVHETFITECYVLRTPIEYKENKLWRSLNEA